MSGNLTRFTDFAKTDDEFTPKPPSALIEILLALARIQRTHTVIDLGRGNRPA